MLHPLIKCVNFGVIEGNGLIAQGLIHEGEVIYRCDLGSEHVLLLPIEEVLGWPEEKRATYIKYSYQYDATRLSFEDDDGRFMNHSCDPNTWSLFGDDDIMVARRDIQPGEEVTYDYATTQVDMPLHFECRCGSANCRGIVTNLDYQNPEWRAQYGSNLPTHTLHTIQAYLEAKAQ